MEKEKDIKSLASDDGLFVSQDGTLAIDDVDNRIGTSVFTPINISCTVWHRSSSNPLPLAISVTCGSNIYDDFAINTNGNVIQIVFQISANNQRKLKTRYATFDAASSTNDLEISFYQGGALLAQSYAKKQKHTIAYATVRNDLV